MSKQNYTLEDFEWVWKDSSVYDILNQFYYEHIDLQKALQQIDQLTNNWNELEKWLEYEERHTMQQNNYHSVLDKMKEIKGSNNEFK